jgi:hypothetical protein
MTMRSRVDEDWELGPTELLEQAFHLLRSLPAGALAWCVLGPLPFVLGLLFFWSDMSAAGATAVSGAGWAAALAVLFAWLKITQAFFARAVWARLLPEGGLPPLGATGLIRRSAALIFLSAFGLPLQILAANLLLPFAWVYATFQNAVVFAYTQDFDHRCCRRLFQLAARESHHEPLLNHLLLLLLLLLAIMVTLGLFTAGLALPFLFKILTGVESIFTRNPMAAAFSSLYLTVVLSMAWLILSPFFRVTYVLRTFYSRSRPTGQDLLSRLHSLRRRAAAAAAAVVLAITCVPSVHAEEPAPTTTVASESRFDAAIRRTMARREYQWRLPPEAGSEEARESGLQAGIRQFFEKIRGTFRDISRRIEEMLDSLLRYRGKVSPDGSPEGGAMDPSAIRGLVYVLAGLLLLGLLGFAVRWLLVRRRSAPVAPAPSPAPAVDLTNEATLASELPEDEWMRLAREKLAAGDPRLAVRALFLAILSSLGEQRLIEIGRSKSNLDYRRELRLRAPSRRDLPEVFGRSVGLFERVWYGLHDALPQWIQEMMDAYERIKRAPSP